MQGQTRVRRSAVFWSGGPNMKITLRCNHKSSACEQSRATYTDRFGARRVFRISYAARAFSRGNFPASTIYRTFLHRDFTERSPFFAHTLGINVYLPESRVRVDSRKARSASARRDTRVQPGGLKLQESAVCSCTLHRNKDLRSHHQRGVELKKMLPSTSRFIPVPFYSAAD